MVKGLEKFRKYFEDFADHYILIGGAACDEHLTGSGLNGKEIIEQISKTFLL